MNPLDSRIVRVNYATHGPTVSMPMAQPSYNQPFPQPYIQNQPSSGVHISAPQPSYKTILFLSKTTTV